MRYGGEAKGLKGREGAAVDRVVALDAQLDRLRRMEAENPVYREMLAAAQVRHTGPGAEAPAPFVWPDDQP